MSILAMMKTDQMLLALHPPYSNPRKAVVVREKTYCCRHCWYPVQQLLFPLGRRMYWEEMKGKGILEL
ncbi:hypothetical protein AB205_0213750 [Aquarana catesbeiana]|uniref:Uncharacterized protein n=1 Tax=Aquarana catesbeiana TaxID=8400 RepID=A0A2G9Q9Q0_AQUCT|nr:hypothetical protein AB205_0213750 [Aquarana catesbeiana]